MKTSRLLAVHFCLLSVVALAGCSSSPPTRLYRIEPVHGSESGNAGTSITIAVGPVRLPEHLRRKEILQRTEPYRLTAAEFDRWAEPLGDSIASALTENISALVSTCRVVDSRWAAGHGADYVVHVQVITFAADPDGNVRLNAAWFIDGNDDTMGHQKASYTAPPYGSDVLATVAAMSQAIGQLSQSIADYINELPPVPRDD